MCSSVLSEGARVAFDTPQRKRVHSILAVRGGSCGLNVIIPLPSGLWLSVRGLWRAVGRVIPAVRGLHRCGLVSRLRGISGLVTGRGRLGVSHRRDGLCVCVCMHIGNSRSHRLACTQAAHRPTQTDRTEGDGNTGTSAPKEHTVHTHTHTRQKITHTHFHKRARSQHKHTQTRRHANNTERETHTRARADRHTHGPTVTETHTHTHTPTHHRCTRAAHL